MKYHVALTAMAMAVASPSYAATFISQTVDIAAASAPTTKTVQFNAFDTSLGTLDSVVLLFSSSLNATGTAYNNSNAAKSYTLTKGASASLSGNGFNISETLASGTVNLGTIGAKATVNLAPINGSGSDSATLLTGFSPFTGASPVSFNFQSFNAFSLSNPSVLTLNALIGGSATLTYNYTVATAVPNSPAPEPATWAMMVGGFGILGAAMRRRTRTNLTFA